MVTDWFNTIRLRRILIVAYSTLALLCIWFASLSWRYPLEYGYWIADPSDDYGHLRKDLINLESSKPSLVFIASSAFREAIMEESSLQRRFSSNDVRLLTAGDLNPLEILQVVSLLPREQIGTVVIEVSHRNFSISYEKAKYLAQHSRLGVDSVRSHMALSTLNIYVPWGLSTVIFYGSRLDPLNPNKVPHHEWLFHQVDFFDPNEFEIEHSIQKVRRWVIDSSIHGDWNQKVYEQIIAEVPENMKIIFVRSPRNTVVFEQGTLDLDEEVRRYEERLQILQESADAAIWDIDNGLNQDHFLDHGHINTFRGREIATQNLIKLIERHFSSDDQLKGAP